MYTIILHYLSDANFLKIKFRVLYNGILIRIILSEFLTFNITLFNVELLIKSKRRDSRSGIEDENSDVAR